MIPDSRWFDDDPNDHTNPEHFCPLDTECSLCKHPVSSHTGFGCARFVKVGEDSWGVCHYYGNPQCKRTWGNPR